MNRRAKSEPLRTLILMAAAPLTLLAAGCAEEQIGPSPDGVDLRGSTLGGEFTLTDNTGGETSWSDFNGQYRLVYFGFTYCPDICPTDVQRFSQGLMQFERDQPELGASVQPIFISVDPDRDTPEIIDQFVGNFHPRLIGLTGSTEQIEQVKTLFGAGATLGPETAPGVYDVAHSTLTYLFSPSGEPLGVIPTDKGADGVKRELEKWIR